MIKKYDFSKNPRKNKILKIIRKRRNKLRFFSLSHLNVSRGGGGGGIGWNIYTILLDK